MHSLAGIHKINNEAVAKAKALREGKLGESETARHCSYAGDVDSGIVLHSAKNRSTAFVAKGAKSRAFLATWFGTNSAQKRDELVESYFAHSPRV